jgi:thiazole synthase ThiGH ThiG subunit
VKLEVLGEAKTLYPDMRETLKATEVLGEGGLPADGLLRRRSDRRQAARRGRAGGDHAVGRADRIGAWASRTASPSA